MICLDMFLSVIALIIASPVTVSKAPEMSAKVPTQNFFLYRLSSICETTRKAAVSVDESFRKAC